MQLIIRYICVYWKLVTNLSIKESSGWQVNVRSKYCKIDLGRNKFIMFSFFMVSIPFKYYIA